MVSAIRWMLSKCSVTLKCNEKKQRSTQIREQGGADSRTDAVGAEESPRESHAAEPVGNHQIRIMLCKHSRVMHLAVGYIMVQAACAHFVSASSSSSFLCCCV